MGQVEKSTSKLLNLNGSLAWQELESLLKGMGFKPASGAGSRVNFFSPSFKNGNQFTSPTPG